MNTRLSDMEINAKLGANASDRAVQILKVIAGAVPIANSLLTELICEIIPNQRQERLEKFTTSIGRRLAELDVKFDELAASLSVSQVALFEEGARSSSQATSDTRIERVAKMVAEGLAQAESGVEERRLLLDFLRSISEEDLAILEIFTAGRFPQARAENWPDQHRRQTMLNLQISRLTSLGLIAQGMDYGFSDAAQDDQLRLIKTPQLPRVTELGAFVVKSVRLHDTETK